MGGGLVGKSVGKADFLSVYLILSSPRIMQICHPLAYRLSVLTPLHSDQVRLGGCCLVPYGGTDPFDMFFKRTADILSPRLSVVFRQLLRLSSFPACWKHDDVTQIPKASPSSTVAYKGRWGLKHFPVAILTQG